LIIITITMINYKRPGDALKPGEDEIEGLKLRLSQKLSPTNQVGLDTKDWEVGELLSIWYRPNFENFMVIHPLFFIFLFFSEKKNNIIIK